MTLRAAALLAGLLVMAATLAEGQTPVRVRGMVTAVDGNTLSVRTREGQDVRVALGDKTAVATVQTVNLADIKPGDGLGATTTAGPDGTRIALEVHVFPASMGVPNEGHRPWDLAPGSTMTNARVSAVVQATSGRELTLSYKDGSLKVMVPDGVPVVTAVPADRSALKPGEYVFFGAERGADGTLNPTGRIQVSKDGVRPPM